ncbi:hypothetical protein BKA62DRAFT_772474 [Auriculariales sp. MPI-PUGE-AT-0066]|nr:hypothetical protein BKA62DRAFT_772474 [Auriculariales sp. MPI-PUGE-AT-0066]
MQSRVAIFFGLNAIRFFSLVGLILVFASSIVVLVNDIHAIQRAGQPQVIDGSDGEAFDQAECFDYLEGSTVPNQPAGAFWAIVNRFLIIFEIMFLFLSEVGWPSKFFATYFPVLGPDFGVGALGVFECLIGAAVLSHRVNDFALVSAFFLFSVGCLNILAGLIFRESSRPRRSLTEWHDSKKPMLPTTIIPRDQLDSGASSFISNAEKAYPLPIHSGHPTPIEATPIHGEYASASLQPGKGFGRAAGMGENSGLKGFLISRPVESLPRYHTRPGASPVPGAYPSGGAGF